MRGGGGGESEAGWTTHCPNLPLVSRLGTVGAEGAGQRVVKTSRVGWVTRGISEDGRESYRWGDRGVQMVEKRGG